MTNQTYTPPLTERYELNFEKNILSGDIEHLDYSNDEGLFGNEN